MTKLTSLALGAGLALASVGFAHAADSTAVTGAWTLTVGAYDAPCTLTLTPDASRTSLVCGAGSVGCTAPSALAVAARARGAVAAYLTRTSFET